MYVAAQSLLNGQILYNYIALLFSSTIISYSLHRIGKPHLSWAHLTIGLLLGVAGLIYFIANFDIDQITYLIVPTILTANYLLSRHLKIVSVRTNQWLKPISISFAYAWCALGPNYMNHESLLLLFTFAIIFFQVLSLSIIFEIKDKNIDRTEGITTLAHTLSLKNIKKLTSSLLIITTVILLTLTLFHELALWLTLWLLKVYVVQYILIYYVSFEKNVTYYYLYADGLLILTGLYPAINIFIIK